MAGSVSLSIEQSPGWQQCRWFLISNYQNLSHEHLWLPRFLLNKELSGEGLQQPNLFCLLAENLCPAHDVPYDATRYIDIYLS